MLTIVTPVLNGARFIRHNVLSVACLKSEHEHIVVDGGSTDGTVEILAEYPEVKVLSQKVASGMYGAINEGVAASSGDAIAYINSDDAIVPPVFEKLYHRLSDGIDIVYGDAFFKFENTGKLQLRSGVPWSEKFLEFGFFPFVQPSSIYTKAAFVSVGGFDISYRIAGDLDLFNRFCKNRYKFVYMQGVASVFLKHGSSLGDKNEQLYYKELSRIGLRKNFIRRAIFFILLRAMNGINAFSGIQREGKCAVIQMQSLWTQ